MSEPILNLATAIFDKIEGSGIPAAAKFFERSEAMIKKWAGGTVLPDVGAAQRILDEALAAGALELPIAIEQGVTIPPKEIQELKKHKTAIEDGNESQKLSLGPERLKKMMAQGKKYRILCPTHRDYPPMVVLSILANWKATLPPEIRALLATLEIESDTLIHRARNILATRFLAGKDEWSVWFDSDNIAPIGNPKWFNHRANSKIDDKWLNRAALETLTSRGKTFIGAVYAGRNHRRIIIAQPGLSPSGEGDKQAMEKLRISGPQDLIMQVGWVGFGCTAVHRQVFEDILRTQPEVKATNEGEPHGFFTAFENGPNGEDTAFAKRALQAGHPCYLDCSVFSGHFGRTCFMP